LVIRRGLHPGTEVDPQSDGVSQTVEGGIGEETFPVDQGPQRGGVILGEENGTEIATVRQG
jgi:hypothetical protein